MIKQSILNIKNNLFSWKTKRKIIVIESDDWGAIRISSKKALSKLIDKGCVKDNDKFNNYDTLSSKNDLYDLFNTLDKHKDINGSSAKFTPLTIVANPDFSSITKNNYAEYKYIDLKETLNHYNNRYNSNYHNTFKVWLDGIEAKLFKPQLHGREHINVTRWMKCLSKADRNVCIGFKSESIGMRPSTITNAKFGYMAPFECYTEEEKLYSETVIKDSINIFENLFDYKPTSFMAPCGVWYPKIEEILQLNGIYSMQSGKRQYLPFINSINDQISLKSINHYTGEKNSNSATYSVRNCKFEPANYSNINKAVDDCLRDISIAFILKCPAIISSHRVNYAGELCNKNKEHGLLALDLLLKKISFNWPDVEFMFSDELAYSLYT